MDMIPRNDYGERCQFDAYCKLVLYHEAIDYLREMQRRRDRELSFSDLPQMEMLRNLRLLSMPSLIFAMSVRRRNRQNRSLRPWTLKALWSSFRSRRSWQVRSQP